MEKLCPMLPMLQRGSSVLIQLGNQVYQDRFITFIPIM